MKRKKTKVLILLFILVLVIGIVTMRIVYVNTVNFSITKSVVGSIDTPIEYDGMIFEISNHKIYSGEELNNMYNNDIIDITDEYDLLFNLTIKNNSNEERKYNAVASGIMYGYENGGNVNPWLYRYFNSDVPGTIELKPNEKITVTLAFPCRENPDNITFVLSIYPENVRFKLQ